LDNIAKIYFDTGNYPESLEALDVIITHYPAHIDAYKKRAQVYRRMNRVEEAQADSKRFMELSAELAVYAKDLNQSG
jgi:tetratricopeptide (TPR) repeat protein